MDIEAKATTKNAAQEADKNIARGRLILVLGGARSGKSTFAEDLVGRIGGQVAYIATSQALDDEMRDRIRLHRERRPANWVTIEETHWVADRLAGLEADVVLLDCLTLLISNLLLDEEFGSPENKTEAILKEITKLAQAARDSKADVIVVSNEVGQGLVPTYPLGRLYRDVAGWANQIMARQADEVYMVIAGIPVELQELGRKVREGLREDEHYDS
ncbi:MAG TPA: bifunctional adenosylcobinamide kinase/adenosylcobinamide-phosphate guanylyltransferase [Bacillota bacterium]|nr:bifunctional adenosylcobinamide kinase/adenosylcobinamide-phosphate guanylyltransferase [Bacillota bacterium]